MCERLPHMAHTASISRTRLHITMMLICTDLLCPTVHATGDAPATLPAMAAPLKSFGAAVTTLRELPTPLLLALPYSGMSSLSWVASGNPVSLRPVDSSTEVGYKDDNPTISAEIGFYR